MPKPLLCVTVTAPTMADLRRQRDASHEADIVELRLDAVADPDVAGALAGRTGPVIVTCRPQWEGGLFRGSEEERHRLLEEAVMRGAEYVDVEWQARFDDLVAARNGRGIVVSMHDFDGTPADLTDRARAMRATGAEVVKIAVHAARLSDCVSLLQLGPVLGDDGACVLIAMGERGLITRALAARFGSRWTYAGSLADVGQISVASLLSDYRFRVLDRSTSVFGLVGSPVAHSVSPAMHNAAFRAAGLDAVYLPFHAADADDFMTFARAFDVRGASVTIPFKVDLFDRMDEVSDVAREIGAINTIVRTERGWLGTNTDVTGFLRPLERLGASVKGMRASILGTGGSARAVAVALGRGGATVTVHGRKPAQAAAVAARVAGQVGEWPPESGSWDLLVNCTPVGMYPRVADTPLPKQLLTGRIVYDLVYNPATTRLLGDAAEAGCTTIGGLDMLVAQAEEQLRLWTGAEPATGVMRDAAQKRLREFASDEDHLV